MSTFAQVAHEARAIAPSQSLGSIDYCRMIARLAEALDRFEHNVAQALIHKSEVEPGYYMYPGEESAALRRQLQALRQEIPEYAKPQGETPQ